MNNNDITNNIPHNNVIDIDDITKALKVKHTWTIFKIIITTDVKKLGIEDIVSKEYIKIRIMRIKNLTLYF